MNIHQIIHWLANHKPVVLALIAVGVWVALSLLACLFLARAAEEYPAIEATDGPLEDCLDGTCNHRHGDQQI